MCFISFGGSNSDDHQISRFVDYQQYLNRDISQEIYDLENNIEFWSDKLANKSDEYLFHLKIAQY